MPRQLITIAAVLAVAVLTLPACHLLPTEPWMVAAKFECEQHDMELVDYLSQCPAEYEPRYCHGLAVLAVCKEEVLP